MNLKEKLNEVFSDTNRCESWMYEDYDKDIIDGVEVKMVQQFGGEGSGDDFYAIYSFDDGNEKVYLKFSGWYASYHGAEFSSKYYVEPEERTITVYVAV